MVLDDHAAAELDAQSGESVSRIGVPRGAAPGDGWGMTATGAEYADTGGASRFFKVIATTQEDDPCSIASGPGSDGTSTTGTTPPERSEAGASSGAQVAGSPTSTDGARFYYTAKADATERPNVAGVRHPTVKPLDLMRWLVRLVTPPGGVVLEPFAGSGTTVEACLLEGFQCIAIEREVDYLPLVVARITRQRDPVAHVQLVGDDNLTLFDATEAAQ